MAWDHLSINKPHLVYIILGGFTSLFMLCSSFVKERMYIGEATVATLCGVIFGPHAANLINPLTWGNTDQITIEFSRIVLVVQCFAVGVELPKYYMEKHWRSVVFLLIPVMTFGWLITSLFVWWMIPTLDWLESLCVAACVTATDPVLASSVVGKGKFAKRVPKHLRDLLSAESGCNDGMAFPFIYLALYIIHYRYEPKDVAFHWIVISILYECVFGAFYGFMIGYIGRHGIKYAEKHDLVDRESFLVFYFVLALFCAGSGSILGTDDLLVGFAAGVGFSNDGWFTQKTEESHVSNVIDLLLNLAYFVYLGTIIPWDQYNSPELGTTPWRLVVIAIFVILFRRIPIMMALKPLIPDVATWREALFAGHFGPIGVGAIFVAILARADLETGGTTPLAELPAADVPHYTLIALIWPIVTFLVISSIMVHGSSIAVFTLGKHINTLTLTMSYTTANEDGPSWMGRLPRIASQSKSMSKQSFASDDLKMDPIQVPPGTLPPVGIAGTFLRRQKEEDNPSRNASRSSSLVAKRRRKHKSWDNLGPGGPISESAIRPARRVDTIQSNTTSTTLTPETSEEGEKEGEKEVGERDIGEVQHDPEMEEIMHRHSTEEGRDQHKSDAERHPDRTETYVEGDHLITENEDGDVLTVQQTPSRTDARGAEEAGETPGADITGAYKNLRKKFGVWMNKDDAVAEGSRLGSSRREKKEAAEKETKRGPALVYQFGNTVIVEDADGEVVKKYDLPHQNSRKMSMIGEGGAVEGSVRQGLARMGTWTTKRKEGDPTDPAVKDNDGISRMGTWTGFGSKKDDETDLNKKASKKTKDEEEDDDRRIRFTIGGAGRRLTKDDFLKEIQQLDPKARQRVMDSSNAPADMKEMARKDASDDTPGSARLFGARNTQVAVGTKEATVIGAKMARNRGASVASEGEGSPVDVRSPDSRQGRIDLGHHLEKVNSPATIEAEQQETAAERRRREEVLKSVVESRSNSNSRSVSRRNSDSDSDNGNHNDNNNNEPTASTAADRRRALAIALIQQPSGSGNGAASPTTETPAERRRREAALGLSGGAGDDSDSEDDNTERVPKAKEKEREVPATRRGIRFAEEPVRGRK